MILNGAFFCFGLALVVPLVVIDLEQATTTEHPGATGAEGEFYVGAFYANYRRYPVGGYVSCDPPSSGSILETADIFCDATQYALPVLLGLLGLVSTLGSSWTRVLHGIILGVGATAILCAVIVLDKRTYKNTGDAAPKVYWGFGLLVGGIVFLCAFVVKGVFHRQKTGFQLLDNM